MAWEWVAPVATGLVGVAGIAGTYFNGRLQTNTSVRLAREERTQNRLERAYLEVQRVVERYAQWADATMPIISAAGHDPHPPLPENDGQMLEATALRLYWSPEVRELVQAWTDARNRLAAQSLAARVHERLNADAWMKAPELKQAIRDTEEALLARMSEELRAVQPVQRRRWRPLAARTRPKSRGPSRLWRPPSK